jgi:malonate-semialdehyde dehydrogenase (acetylating)/methylmalonate-semialdehyde dehydrogenase
MAVKLRPETKTTEIIMPFLGRSYEFCHYIGCKNWIGGQWCEGIGGKVLPVENPRYGRAMGDVVLSDQRDVQRAVAAAKEALPGWRATPIKERAQVLYRVKQLIESSRDEIAWLVSHENGKTYEEALGSIDRGVECIELGAALANMGAGEQLAVSRGITCQVTYEPLGVCAGIMPFNFPFMVPLWMIPNALVAGNTFVLKPSEQVPYSAIRLASLFKEAGLPAGVLNIVNGAREAVEGILDDPDIRAIGFVGSTRVARIVYQRGSASGKRVLALGGAKNHLIVVPDADPELTADTAVKSAFGCSGQRCMASSVMVAVGPVDEIIRRTVEKAKKVALGRDMGPVISAQAEARIKGHIAGAERDGALVLVDGRRDAAPGGVGNWVGPTVLDHVPPNSLAATEEIFGPVLSIVRVKTVDEAIAIENASPYGNAAAIFTQNGGVAEYVLDRLEAGMCGVNIGVPVPREPFGFGGWNESKFGNGDITGMDGFRFWTRARKVTTKWKQNSDETWMS